MQELTQARLKEKLHYDPETGVFTWIAPTSPRVKVGDTAGYNQHGYVNIQVAGSGYKAHRLAFLYMTGDWPPDQVDHINRDRADNRWSNLRLTTPLGNAQNASVRRDNTSGFRGVYWHRIMQQWKALIRVNKTPVHIGYFATKREATIAYILESLERYGDFSPYNCKGGVA